MPNFFRQSQYASFQRQLNLYGFRRLSQKSSESGSYYHEKFLRTRADLCQEILRAKEKDLRAIKASQEEPDFCKMPHMPPITDEDIGTTESILMEQKTGAKEGQEMNAMVVESLSLKKGKEDPLADWLETIAMSRIDSNDSWMEPRPIAPVPMMNTQQAPPSAVGDVPMQDCFALPKPAPMALPSFLTARTPDACNPMGNFPLSLQMNQPTSCSPDQNQSVGKVNNLPFLTQQEKLPEKRAMISSPSDSQERSTKRLAAEAGCPNWRKRPEDFGREEVAGMVAFLQDVDFD